MKENSLRKKTERKPIAGLRLAAGVGPRFPHTILESGFDDLQCRQNVAEVGGVACDDTLESPGECCDQDIGYWALYDLKLSASDLELMPEAMREERVRRGPEFGGADLHCFEKCLRRRIVASEGRAKLHKCYRADDQAVMEMGLQAGS